MEIAEDVGVKIHDNMKDPVFPFKKNPRVEVFSRGNLRKSDGRWMKKERVIDKERDY